MKNSNLNQSGFAGAQLLSRTQLKNVTGGYTPVAGGGGDCDDECQTDEDCKGTYKSCKTYADPACNKNIKACTN